VAIAPVQVYAPIEDVLLLARVHVNDTFAGATGTPGEGRVFTDSAPFILPILNDALADYIRKMHNKGVTILKKEVFITNIPPVNGPSGLGVPDPAIQPFLGYNGYFDGLQLYKNPVLPCDLIVPLKLWQRNSGTGLTFGNFLPAEDGLGSHYQNNTFGNWEWRGDALYWNGALVQKDIRLRYLNTIQFFPTGTPASSFPTTSIPLRDSVSALALLCAEKFCAARLPEGATAGLLAKIELAINEVSNRYVRLKQHVGYGRDSFGDEESSIFEGGW
jgi:hypothetical protein